MKVLKLPKLPKLSLPKLTNINGKLPKDIKLPMSLPKSLRSLKRVGFNKKGLEKFNDAMDVTDMATTVI